MGTMKAKMKAKVQKQNLPSGSTNATVNRAGGVAFDIKNPAVKLITMTGGSFFAEPRYYTADNCVPKRMDGGEFGKLEERLRINKEDALSISKSCEELDDVAQEILATAWKVLKSDHPKDLLSIAHWLREEMNIRLTPQVLLVLASRHEAAQPFVREYARKVIVRPDEVKTCVMLHKYFFGHKTMKNCLARGLADAVSKFGERGLIKYEGQGYPQWKDVLCQLHKRKKDYPLTAPVAKYFLDGTVDPEGTPIAYARRQLTQCQSFGTKAKSLVSKSLANWEVVLTQFGKTPEAKKEVWQYLIKENLVGYMAMLRNLRNLLQAGVDKKTIDLVYDKLSDREQVLRSRQLPFRFAMAYEILHGGMGNHGGFWGESNHAPVNNSHQNRILEAIENAVDHACENVPEIPGTTVLFADNSGSMDQTVSERSKVSCRLAANILCAMAAKRGGEAIVCAFATDVAPVTWTKNTTAIEISKRLSKADTKGLSTNGHLCIKWMERQKIKPDRVILLSDMQCWTDGYGYNGNVADAWHRFAKSNKQSWLHCVNLNGYGDSVVEETKDKVNLVGGFSEKIAQMLLTTEGVIAEEALPTLDQIRAKW